jgi:uncharacterized membrane protein
MLMESKDCRKLQQVQTQQWLQLAVNPCTENSLYRDRVQRAAVVEGNRDAASSIQLCFVRCRKFKSEAIQDSIRRGFFRSFGNQGQWFVAVQ